MSANSELRETELVDGAVDWLNAYLPTGWEAERSALNVGGTGGREQTTIDPVINVRVAGNQTAMFVVEARRSVAPRDMQRLMAGLSRTFRSLTNAQVLVVAPWLSARAQELLREDEISYVDLTGNAWIRSDYPALFVSAVGAARNPQPRGRESAQLRGPKAGRLVRTLVDVRPPYGVRDLAKATGLNPGYVSRLLEALNREALVDRSDRGEVLSVDYAALLRRWTDTYEVFKSNELRRFVAPEGASGAIEKLKTSAMTGRVAVSGSFAAVRHAPVASPALLVAYADSLAEVAEALNLLSADEGSNVVLLRPFDEAVWERLERDDGIAYVSPSQAVADCLTGTGRMPSEGQALLEWITEDEDRWRIPSLDDLGASA
jgi:hypothetical protein